MIDLMNTPETVAAGLQFVLVDPICNYKALQVQQQIWPHNPPDQDYIDKAYDLSDRTNASWLVYHRADLVGLTGVYTFDPPGTDGADDPGESGYDGGKSIWMDWFAVLPQYRGQSFGRHILLATIAYAQALQRFKYFRLDTTDFPGRASTHLYDQVMQLREDYTAESMPSGHRGLVYSYSLDGSPIKPWNNQLLNLNYYGAAEVQII